MGMAEQDVPFRRSANPREFADFYAVAEMYGAGAVLHGDWENLQRCIPPGLNAQRCAEAVRDVWLSGGIPLRAASDGTYTRGGLDTFPFEHVDRFDDAGRENLAGAVRSFGMFLDATHFVGVVVQPGQDWQFRERLGWRVVKWGGPHQQIVWMER